MEIQKLANELKEKYERAYKEEYVAQIHLFGIKHGKLIRDKSYSPKEIIKLSGLKESYLTELNKGIKLSNYVKYPNKELNSAKLGKILENDILNAKKGDNLVAKIHLFGIKYGNYIRLNNISLNEIIEKSNINNSYLTELNKGVKLSKYVNTECK